MDGSPDVASRRADRDTITPTLVLVLAAAVVLETAFILLFSPFMTTDSAAHIGSATAFLDSISGGFDMGDRFLEWNPWPAPSILGNLVLVALLPVFGIEWGERLALVGYVVALPLATLYAVRAMRPGPGWLACFAIPLTFSLCVLWGFLSFSYSVAAFLVAAGFLLRSPARMTQGRTAALAALLLLVFFSHLVSWAVACLFVAIVLTTRALVRPELRGNIAAHGLVALVPSAALALTYVASSGAGQGPAWSYSPLRKLAGVVTMSWGVVTYDRLEIALCLAAALALAALILVAARRTRPWRQRDPDTLAVGVFTIVAGLLAVVAPDDVGSGSFISHRLALFPIFGALIWLAGQQIPRSYVAAGGGVAVAVAVGLALVRYDDLRDVERVGRDLRPLVSCVEDGRTLVQGNLARVGFGSAGRIEQLTDETGRIAAVTDGLPLLNVDYRVPQWVQRFRAETSPKRHLVLPGVHEVEVPPHLDFQAFERATGMPVDYVVLFARSEMSRETLSSAAFRRFDRSLQDGYRLVGRSPLGWWELWLSQSRAVADSECPRDGPAAIAATARAEAFVLERSVVHGPR